MAPSRPAARGAPPRVGSPRPARTSMARRAATLLAAAFVAAACGDDGSASPAGLTAADLDGREFTSLTVSGVELVPDTYVNLAFEDGRMAAFAGCNTLSAGYQLDNTTLVVDDALAMTRMMCDEPRMAQDAWLADLLAARPTIALDGDDLTVTQGDVTVVLRDPSDAADRLEGTTWRIEEFVVDGGPLGVPDGAAVSFAEEAVSVATGCNVAFGPVAIGDGSVSFGPLGVTMMLCDGDLGAFEAALLGFLESELAYEVDGRVVTLTSGSSALTLRKVPNT